MFAACKGAKPGASSITTRPLGKSRYSVLAGSSGRQSAGVDAARMSAIALEWAGLGLSAATSAACAIKVQPARAKASVVNFSRFMAISSI